MPGMNPSFYQTSRSVSDPFGRVGGSGTSSDRSSRNVFSQSSGNPSGQSSRNTPGPFMPDFRRLVGGDSPDPFYIPVGPTTPQPVANYKAVPENGLFIRPPLVRPDRPVPTADLNGSPSKAFLPRREPPRSVPTAPQPLPRSLPEPVNLHEAGEYMPTATVQHWMVLTSRDVMLLSNALLPRLEKEIVMAETQLKELRETVESHKWANLSAKQMNAVFERLDTLEDRKRRSEWELSLYSDIKKRLNHFVDKALPEKH